MTFPAVCCGGACVDPFKDSKNCGACGLACAEATDQAVTECCAGACSDVSSDAHNCGECGAVCGPCEICTATICNTRCKPGEIA